MCSGYDYGSFAFSPCGANGGVDLCGSARRPIATKDLTCGGGELSIAECKWSMPDGACLRHALDSVVFSGECSTGRSATNTSLGVHAHVGSCDEVFISPV